MVDNEQEGGEDIESENDSAYCHSERSYHSLYESDEDSDDDPEFVPEEEEVEDEDIEEEECEAENLEKDEAVVHNFEGDDFVVDAEDPSMEKEARFTDVYMFRQALRQHCIKNWFDVNYIKNEKDRVTVRCANHKDCPWRLHASVLQDKHTF